MAPDFGQTLIISQRTKIPQSETERSRIKGADTKRYTPIQNLYSVTRRPDVKPVDRHMRLPEHMLRLKTKGESA